jgi:hypothetical protein
MKRSWLLRSWSLTLVLLVAALACNFPGLSGPDSPAASPSPSASPTDLPFQEDPGDAGDGTPAAASPSPSPSPTPEDVEEDGCTLRAAFVEDVTIPDDTEIEPGAEFVKTWRIRNTSTCDWETGTQLIPIQGDDLGGPEAVAVPPTPVDGEVELSVTLTAPENPGTYRSNWQLRTPDGNRFGGVFYAQIVVPGEPTPTPTATPDADAEPEPPSLLLGAVAEDCSAVTLTWVDAVGERSYQLVGPDLNVNLGADTTLHTWDDPPSGTSIVKLTAIDENGDAMGTIETTVSVTCDGDPADLTVASVTFDPASPVARLPVTVTVRVENVGAGDSGNFLAAWWSTKTAPSSTCRWTVTEGLAAGDARDLTCRVAAYSGAFANLVTVAEVDVSSLVYEADEENNALESTIAVVEPEVVYDFVDGAGEAEWAGGPPTGALPWPGTPGDDAGFVRLTGGTLETGGAVQGLCLETRPRPVAGGWVRGEFDTIAAPAEYVVATGDHLHLSLGMLDAAAPDGAVTYRVLLILSEEGATEIAAVPHTYGTGIQTLALDLSSYAGQTAIVVLHVDGGEQPDNDRPCWLEARIYRYP